MPGMMKKSAGNTERMIGYAKRTPTPKPTATKSAAPKPKAKPKTKAKPKSTKKGLTVTLGNGVTMDLNTGVKTTPKPTPSALPTISNKEYLRRQKEFLKKQRLERQRKAKKR